jgi:hypothetical protein
MDIQSILVLTSWTTENKFHILIGLKTCRNKLLNAQTERAKGTQTLYSLVLSLSDFLSLNLFQSTWCLPNGQYFLCSPNHVTHFPLPDISKDFITPTPEKGITIKSETTMFNETSKCLQHSILFNTENRLYIAWPSYPSIQTGVQEGEDISNVIKQTKTRKLITSLNMCQKPITIILSHKCCLTIFIHYFSYGATAHTWALSSSLLRFLKHIQLDTR